MFDEVPVRVWLMIAIAATAFAPAQYVFRHIAHAPSRREITQPKEDLSWRTSRQLARSLFVLLLLAALAVFIFTKTAERMAHSPQFWPLLIAGLGAWAMFTVAQGFVTGRVELLMRGFSVTYERAAQPKRFWASLTWNSLMGGVCLWAAYIAHEDASVERLSNRCIHAEDVRTLNDQLSACDEWISIRPESSGYFERGLIFLDLGDLRRAAADFTKAHDLDPDDPWPLANRGLTMAWMKEPAKAEADFTSVRSMDPTNPVMFRGQAILRMNAGDLQGAAERLTRSMERDPENLWALRTRSEIYWELGQYEASAEDDRRWVQLKDQAR